MSDHELLQSYARHRTDTAFGRLVDRYVNLVYSAAARQVRSPQLAEEVASSVFLELARRASEIPSTQPLAAWLYVVTRRMAINALRHESRRLARETTAAEIAAMKTPSETWSKVEAVVDEAMATLNDHERSAIILRFFHNLSLREVGAELGISEDTAQKRVSRALDRLRDTFAARGVAVSGATLAADFSAHALQAAPSGLGAMITAHAATFTATVKAAETIAMTTLQKTAVAAAFALVASVGLYEASALRAQSAAVAATEAALARLRADQSALESSRATTTSRLKSVETQIDARLAQAATASTPADIALEAQMLDWLAQLDRFKQWLAQKPGRIGPEMRLLDEENWLNQIAGARLDSEEAMRRAAASLRQSAHGRFTNRLQRALRTYVESHDGLLPANIRDLEPLFDPPVDPALLGLYEMLQSGKVTDVPAPEQSRLVGPSRPADPEFDTFYTVGLTGGTGGTALNYNYRAAQRGFAKANDGRSATAAAQLRPYLKWPVDETALQQFMSSLPAPPAR